jgi:two-component system NtrC family sensor kinase
VLDAHLSLASVDTQLASQQRALVGFTALASVLACTLSITFIWLVIHKPIKALMKGTRKVASGDLTHRIPVHSVDELGDLATSFNKMTTDLEHAHSEITDWTRTLEDRVQRKSEELEQAHHTLRSSEKLASLGKLAATVAHEVNNPLFGMLTYARLSLKAIQQSSLDENTKAAMSENLRVIERESRRCGEIMRNLLTFARQAPPSRAPSDLNTLLERVIKLVGHQLDLQSIVLEKHLSSDLPQIACDSSQIQQVLLALLINATEAMPQGGTIAVSTEFDPAARAVRTLVRDSGPGIDPEILPQIWEPFFTTKENQHRTGLGLAISRGIIERHGGRIEVDTKAGAGTVFTITLPLDIGAPPATPETPWLETTRTAGV